MTATSFLALAATPLTWIRPRRVVTSCVVGNWAFIRMLVLALPGRENTLINFPNQGHRICCFYPQSTKIESSSIA